MITNGKCSYCLSSFSGNTMGKHLLSCESRQGFFKEFEKITSSPKTIGIEEKKYDEVTFYLLEIFSPDILNIGYTST